VSFTGHKELCKRGVRFSRGEELVDGRREEERDCDLSVWGD
jgi:hypothetical protein